MAELLLHPSAHTLLPSVFSLLPSSFQPSLFFFALFFVHFLLHFLTMNTVQGARLFSTIWSSPRTGSQRSPAVTSPTRHPNSGQHLLELYLTPAPLPRVSGLGNERMCPSHIHSGCEPLSRFLATVDLPVGDRRRFLDPNPARPHRICPHLAGIYSIRHQRGSPHVRCRGLGVSLQCGKELKQWDRRFRRQSALLDLVPAHVLHPWGN